MTNNIQINNLKKENISKEIRDKKICDLYNDFTLVGEIAKKLFIDRHTVTRVLKKYGIYDVNRNKNHLNKDKIARNEKIIQLYKDGLSFNKIAKQMNLGHTTIEYIIHRYIDLNPIQYSIIIDNKTNLIRHRKYDFNTNYFNKIDSEEKAYWLGFLYADGCITHGECKLELSAIDKLHLEKFKQALNCNDKELRYRKEKNSYILYFNSVALVQDLIRLGCMPRKTFLLTFPTYEQVPKTLIHHFMRGYFDGDGCICMRRKKTNVNLFTVIGCRRFIESYKQILFENIGKKIM